jgi:hypothetical protein
MTKQTVGITGTYLVAAELSRRGYIALVTTRNTEDTDILASNPNTGKTASIQVKASQGQNKTKGKDYWILTKKDESLKDRHLFYAFCGIDEAKENAIRAQESRSNASFMVAVIGVVLTVVFGLLSFLESNGISTGLSGECAHH